ncbi:MAG: glycosyltransferase family 2 protein [Mycetocola sp.]
MRNEADYCGQTIRRPSRVSTEGKNTFMLHHTSPHVSVIIPVYNAEGFLGETLESLAEQTINSAVVEVIMVDDGSTDSSGEIIDGFAEANAGWFAVHIPNSGGAATPRNEGLDRATGEYVFFLDADDKLAPEALERMVERAEETGSDVVLCRQESFGDRKRSVARKVFETERFAADFIDSYAYRTLGPWKLFRRTLIEQNKIRFMTGYKNGEDIPFTLEAYIRGNHISTISDQPYYWFRGRSDGGNISNQPQSPQHDFLKSINAIKLIDKLMPEGPRRTILLERSMIDTVGMPQVFGSRFHKLSSSERVRLVEEFKTSAGHLWNSEIRERATNQAKVILDLASDGDVPALTRLSTDISEGKALSLSLDEDAMTLVFRDASGGTHAGMTPDVSVVVTGLDALPGGVELRAKISSPGFIFPASSLRFVWLHRESGSIVPVVESTVHPDNGEVELVGNSTESLNLSGVWDLFVEVTLGTWSKRYRVGAHRTADVLWGDRVLERLPQKTLFFTEYGNISIRQSTARDYPVALYKKLRRTAGVVKRKIRGSSKR